MYVDLMCISSCARDQRALRESTCISANGEGLAGLAKRAPLCTAASLRGNEARRRSAAVARREAQGGGSASSERRRQGDESCRGIRERRTRARV